MAETGRQCGSAPLRVASPGPALGAHVPEAPQVGSIQLGTTTSHSPGLRRANVIGTHGRDGYIPFSRLWMITGYNRQRIRLKASRTGPVDLTQEQRRHRPHTTLDINSTAYHIAPLLLRYTTPRERRPSAQKKRHCPCALHCPFGDSASSSSSSGAHSWAHFAGAGPPGPPASLFLLLSFLVGLPSQSPSAATSRSTLEHPLGCCCLLWTLTAKKNPWTACC